MKRAAQASTRSTRLLTTAALAAGLIALAGCGGSSKTTSSSSESPPASSAASSTPATTSSTPASSESTGGSSLALEADKEGKLEYSTKSLSAKAGKVSIAFTNMSPLGHNVTIESSSGERVGGTETFQGATKTLSLTLKPGTYKFFCSVPGHRAAGMEGTLTVQ